VSRIWQVNPEGAVRRYTVRRDHELIQLLAEQLGKNSGLLYAALDLLERTVPIERVWLDVTERGAPDLEPREDAEVIAAAKSLVDVLAKAGVPFATAVANVAAMDPFDRITDLPQKLAGKRMQGARP
jgi:hypothetical protein